MDPVLGWPGPAKLLQKETPSELLEFFLHWVKHHFWRAIWILARKAES